MEGRDGQDNTSVTFDYSPWERTEKKSVLARYSLLDNSSTSLQPLGRRQTIRKSIFPTSPLKSPSSLSQLSLPPENLFPDLRKECSTLCRHGPKVKAPEVSLPEKKKSKDGNIALLKLLIRERRLALESNKQRYMKLIGENLKLKEEISNFEELNYNDVNGLLTKYKKFQGALGVLNSTHKLSLSEVENELQETEEEIKRKLKVFRNDVEDLEKKIAKEKHALKVLHNYKEKEYPDKLEQMKHLQFEIGTLESEFGAVIQELRGIADQETNKYIANAGASKDEMISDMADITMLSMDSSVKDMSKQNALITREIDLHKEEVDQHRKDISRLEEEIRILKSVEKTNYLRRRHPEQTLERCLPDEEFDLRIPRQRYLPI